uniref:Uncharacterized protein n=1 Tax=Anolis carolinensis TaxID=28377 RepID=H9GUB8_ANOCA
MKLNAYSTPGGPKFAQACSTRHSFSVFVFSNFRNHWIICGLLSLIFVSFLTEIPRLIHTTFRAIKPGLSAYADDVDKSAEGINELLAVAKEDVPENLWKSTPLVLKATAGLRLLPGEKAQELLDKVKSVFQQSPFLVGNDCVSIMDGTDEGT